MSLSQEMSDAAREAAFHRDNAGVFEFISEWLREHPTQKRLAGVKAAMWDEAKRFRHELILLGERGHGYPSP